MHPAVEPLAFLLGTWTGEGDGAYPTIAPFRYREEIRFTENGKPFVAYAQRTWALDDGRPLHSEAGFLRPLGDGVGVEYLLAQPTGIAEIGAGSLRGTRLALAARVTRTATAVEVEEVERDLEVEDDVLRYELRMALPEVTLRRHLVATLRRTGTA